MNLEQIKNNTTKKILEFSIPSIIAMILTSFITIIDGFFVGNYVGKEGLAAINLGLPILYFYLAIGLMLSVGGIAIAGMALGAREYRKCKDVFNQTTIMTLVITIAISFIIYILFSPILRLLHVTNQIATYFTHYYMVMLFTFPLMVLNSQLGMFIRGEGNPQFVMLINVFHVICNIVLDYLFVSVLNYGITGIAIASLISVFIVTLCSIIFFLVKSKNYRFGTFQFSKEVLREMLFNGSSEFIGEMSLSISMYAYNWVIMKTIGVDGIAAFTIVGYLAYIFSMIEIGFGQGLSPLVSFSYGAREMTLVQKIRRKTNLFVFCTGVAFIILLLVGMNWYSSLFVKNEAVTTMVHHGIPIFIISFLFSGINTICSMYFTSIGKAKESAIISSSRGLILLLIFIFTLPYLLGMTGVWLVAPLTEVITVLISGYYLHKNQSSLVTCTE